MFTTAFVFYKKLKTEGSACPWSLLHREGINGWISYPLNHDLCDYELSDQWGVCQTGRHLECTVLDMHGCSILSGVATEQNLSIFMRFWTFKE